MNEHREETFNYTYSGEMHTEIQRIRRKYMTPAEDKMVRLRRLDENVTRRATIRALVVGIIGALIMGLGMSLVMTKLSAVLGAYQDWAMLIGILIGCAGIVLICCAYSIYNNTLKKERERLAPEILRLVDELIQ